jgi:hypothetical protein
MDRIFQNGAILPLHVQGISAPQPKALHRT